MREGLRVRQGGSGEPVLLLLHGMGATGDVWHGLHELLGKRWPGRWVTPDLPGHGGSAPLPVYSFDHLAAVVARVVPLASRVVVLGHSMGGVVALTLASGSFGVPVVAVCGLGIKVAWTDDELARARSLSTRPNPVYLTRAEAAERHLKVAGLQGLVAPEAVPNAALEQGAGGWTLAFDPAVFAIGAPDIAGLLSGSLTSVTLAAGERDPMCRDDQLRRLVSDPVVLRGLGHNAHVEAPDALLPLLEQARALEAPRG